MPIGNFTHNGTEVTASQHLSVYNDLIKPALELSGHNIEIIRSDEVNAQGTITTDILSRLLMSDYVIVDVTYPNPNVFYELGIRHAVRKGTIMIKDETVESRLPFDISTQRCIFYKNTTSGLKKLGADFKSKFDHYLHVENDEKYSDNHILDYAKIIKYKYPSFDDSNGLEQRLGVINLFEGFFSSEALIEELIAIMGEVDERALLMIKAISNAYRKDPENGQRMLLGLIQVGLLDPKRLLGQMLP